MDLPDFLRFTPVPLKARHDGWSAEQQQRFVILLARGARPGEAAQRLGKHRSTAYALRKKLGAESFAAAWDVALRYARHVRLAARRRQPLPDEPRRAPPVAAPSSQARAPASTDPRRRAFDSLLDQLYPSTVPKAAQADKADKADENDETDRKRM